MPSVARWLEQLNEVKNEILNSNSSVDERGWLTERLCVLQSMENIRTYPQVNEREKNGLLRIYGWHYIIQTGEVYSYENEEFILLNKGRK